MKSFLDDLKVKLSLNGLKKTEINEVELKKISSSENKENELFTAHKEDTLKAKVLSS